MIVFFILHVKCTFSFETDLICHIMISHKIQNYHICHQNDHPTQDVSDFMGFFTSINISYSDYRCQFLWLILYRTRTFSFIWCDTKYHHLQFSLHVSGLLCFADPIIGVTGIIFLLMDFFQLYVFHLINQLQKWIACDRSVVFLWILRFPPPIKLTPGYNWNIVESGIKHHNTNPNSSESNGWLYDKYIYRGKWKQIISLYILICKLLQWEKLLYLNLKYLIFYRRN